MPWEGSATSCGKLLLTLPAALHLDLDRHPDEDGAGGDSGGDDVEEEEEEGEDDGTHFLSSLHLNIEPDHVPVCMRMTVMILMIVLRFRMRMMR